MLRTGEQAVVCYIHYPDTNKYEADFMPPNGTTLIYNPDRWSKDRRKVLRTIWRDDWVHFHTDNGMNVPAQYRVIREDFDPLYEHEVVRILSTRVNYEVPGFVQPPAPVAPELAVVANDAVNFNIHEIPERAQPMTKRKKEEFENYKPIDFERSKKLPRFRQKYETEDEARLRLNDSIVTFKDKAFFVEGVVTRPATRELWIRGSSGDGDEFEYIPIDSVGADFRTIDCGYVDYRGNAIYFFRQPARVYKQGITVANSRSMTCGSNSDGRLGVGIDFARCYNVMETKKFDKNLIENNSFAFSRDIAVHKAPIRRAGEIVGFKYTVEYRGNTLGRIHDDEKVGITQETAEVPWIMKALEEVGLKTRVINNAN